MDEQSYYKKIKDSNSRVDKMTVSELSVFLADMENYLSSYYSSDNATFVLNYYKSAIQKKLAKMSSDELKSQKNDMINAVRALYPLNESNEVWGSNWDAVIAFINSAVEKTKEADIQALIEGKTTLSASAFREKLDKAGELTDDDLARIGITRDDVKELATVKVQKFDFNMDPDKKPMPAGYTEVYFWGMPGCGKTCCMGAFLDEVSAEGGSAGFASGYSGAHYFKKLKGSFKSKGLSILFQGTNTKDILFAPFEMNFQNRIKRICLVDLAGEIFKTMSLVNDNQEPDEIAADCLNRACDYLTDTKNRKLQFFLIPYTEDTSNSVYDGINLEDYLDAGVHYLEEHSIIKNSTDGVYIIVTKADGMGVSDDKLDDAAKQWVKKNYSSFFNHLNTIMMAEGIDASKGNERVQVLPFSIGDLVTKEACHFDAKGAKRIINEIYGKAKGTAPKGLIGRFINWITGF